MLFIGSPFALLMERMFMMRRGAAEINLLFCGAAACEKESYAGRNKTPRIGTIGCPSHVDLRDAMAPTCHDRKESRRYRRNLDCGLAL
jgi:hypothetical protein